ncbi:hypothetical protein A3715_14280 [Oleiphilus sp. HI0009]|nr:MULTISPECIES: DUF819 family protein [unclassified Oleiphilus]KZX75557.1 hypothetical protein A3715_14280 [Oleiphilus sp. HI0009]KZY68854.1 hypothetical protein A3739_10250 [Oleiphilus sp. HI0067]KZY69438.1 hypothetical protein A3738_04370 [Oleiphilus sp. HI0066]KZY70539.1 hypothetical protein A3739_17825 [Oleiphilus sp. HI0067]
MIEVCIALLCIVFPAIAITLGLRHALIDRAGLVLVCFASGILLNTLTGSITDVSPFVSNSLINIQTQITELTIALALPLLVFSIDLKSAFTQAGSSSKSMLMAFASIIICTFILSFIFQGHIEGLWQVAGLSVGAYTGGGPNMAAINAAIEGDKDIFVMMTSYDILLSAIYLLFVLSFAKPLFTKVLLPAAQDVLNKSENKFAHLGEETSASYQVLGTLRGLKEGIITAVLSLLIIGLALGLASLLPSSMKSSGTIILITTLGMLASFIPQIRRLTVSFRVGMYLVLVFCFTMGSMTNLSVLADLNWALFSYIGLMLIGAMTIHAGLCRVFKIDVDTFLVTSSAAIMSVPFIPVIVGALRNQALLVPGFCAAITGYVLGNYLGIVVAISLKSIL